MESGLFLSTGSTGKFKESATNLKALYPYSPTIPGAVIVSKSAILLGTSSRRVNALPPTFLTVANSLPYPA